MNSVVDTTIDRHILPELVHHIPDSVLPNIVVMILPNCIDDVLDRLIRCVRLRMLMDGTELSTQTMMMMSDMMVEWKQQSVC